MKEILVCIFVIGLCIGIFLSICINKIVKEKMLIDKEKYFIVGIINAISYTTLYCLYGLGFNMFKYCIFLSIMLVIGIVDFKTKNIYLKVSILAIVLALLLDLYEYIVCGEGLEQYIYGAALAFCIFFLIVKITKGMGEGDIEVAVICGLFLGVRYTLLAILLSFIIGGAAGIVLLLFKRKDKRYEMAFIPYLLMGAYIAVFAGDFLIDWYLKCY